MRRFIIAICALLQLSTAILSGQDHNFTRTAQALIELSPKDSDIEILDSLYQQITSQYSPGDSIQDSLMSIAVTTYASLAVRKQSDDYLPFLRRIRSDIDEVPNAAKEARITMSWLFIDFFRYDYTLDSIELYLRNIEVIAQTLKPPSADMLRLQYESARLAYDKGDYDGSLQYLLSARDYLTQYFPEDTLRAAQIWNAIGIGYRRTGQTAQAISHYLETIDQINQNGPKTFLGTVYNNLGLAYRDVGQYDEATRYLKGAVSFNLNNESASYREIGTGYDNVAACFASQEMYDSAIVYSKQGISFIKNKLGKDHYDLLVPYATLSEVYILIHHYENAAAYNDSAYFLMNKLGWAHDDPGGNFVLDDAFRVLNLRSQINRTLYDITGNREFLFTALNAGAGFIATTDYAYDNFKSSISKSIFTSSYRSGIVLIIDNLYQDYLTTRSDSSINTAFLYTERLKSLELLYAAQRDKADQIPQYKELNAQSQRLSDSITYYSDLIAEYPDSNEVVRKLNSARSALFNWKEEIRQSYANYYDLIFHPSYSSAFDIQSSLQENQSLTSYFLGDSMVYAITIDNDSLFFQKTGFERELTPLIDSLMRAVQGLHEGGQMSEERYLQNVPVFCDISHNLYNILVRPIQSKLKERSVIITDGELSFIPFEILLSSIPDDPFQLRDHPYLIKQHSVNYCYSATMWTEMSAYKFRPKRTGSAYAPKYSTMQNTVFSDLRYSEQEVYDISRITNTRSYTGTDATKAKFFLTAPGRRFIHLAVHGQANTTDATESFLLFSNTDTLDPRLYVSEIYPMQLGAELVTLSACETGVGRIVPGEGVLSLGRAFAFAGVSTIINSLWSVNDHSTARIMASFYEQLAKGIDKDLALRNAKIHYLENSGHVDAHPFFWSSFVSMGSTAPLSQPSSTKWYLGVLLVAALVLLIVYWLNQHNPKRTRHSAMH